MKLLPEFGTCSEGRFLGKRNRLIGGYELNKFKQVCLVVLLLDWLDKLRNLLYRSSLMLSSRIMGIGVTITRGTVEIGVGTWGR